MEELLISYTKEDFRNEIRSIISETIRENTQESPTSKEPEFLTRNEVANMFRFSLVTLHRLQKEGILQPYKIGGRILFKPDEVNQALTKINKKYRRQ